MNYSFFLGLIIAAVVTNVVSNQVYRAGPGEETTGNYIIAIKKEENHCMFEHIADKVRKASTDQRISVKVEGPLVKIIAAKMTEDEANKLVHQKGIEFIEEETYASIDMSWAVDRVDQVSSVLDNKPYTPCECGNGVDVYVLDTGIRYDHCEFGRTKYSDYVFDGGRAKYSGYDPIDNYNDTNLEGRDCHGHGTHVASLAVGNVSGLARCATAYSVRVLDCNGRGPYSVIIDGLNYAAIRIKDSNRPAVIVMSLGGSFSSSLDQVVTNVINQGIPVVASAGNNRGNACSRSPASNPGAITVGSTLIGDFINYNTNAGPCVDIFAPGAYVTAASHTCSSCSCTKVVSGTSMAAALVSGAVALLLENEPFLSPDSIADELKYDCLKNAINLIFLDPSYKSNTNNCFLHIKKCTDVCDITPTSTSIMTRTRPSIYVTIAEHTTFSTAITTIAKSTTLTCATTSTDTVTVTDDATLICNSTSTHHATKIHNSTSTHHIMTTYHTTATRYTSSICNTTSTHHITATHHDTLIHPSTSIQHSTSTKDITVTHTSTLTRHSTSTHDTTLQHPSTSTHHTTATHRATLTHTSTSTHHKTLTRTATMIHPSTSTAWVVKTIAKYAHVTSCCVEASPPVTKTVVITRYRDITVCPGAFH
uniref:Peptidase S8/S53 domain-containing protein n=1 Tax=Amphimedon queenslandica TaxID=400682 RepID=A0A1X7VDP5_AMPQE